MGENEILKVYSEGINSVLTLVKAMTEKIDSLNSEIKSLGDKMEDVTKDNLKLQQRVQSLESQTKKNSNNSSKPPSSDGFKKQTKSLRRSSGKSPGGQIGHKGTTLEKSENPDEIIIHKLYKCDLCGVSLEDILLERYIVRQVVDIPEIKAKVTEHRSEVIKCLCGHINKAAFPEDVLQPVQYGTKLKAASVYLSQNQLIPYKRQSEVFEDLFNIHLSQGTLVSINKSCYEALETVEENIKNKLKESTGTLHFDETGVSVNSILKWLHVTSNEEYTYYNVHAKRGCEAINDIGILSAFKGTAVHDCWKSYFTYTNCDHALCCAHILRELNGITELEKQSWAEDMKKLLLDIKSEVDKTSSLANALIIDRIIHYEKKYDAIVKIGLEEDFKQVIISNTEKPSRKKSKSGNLLNRLSLYKQEILRFMNDFDVPFDNNLAERDIRMTKVKQKISGTFRSSSGADYFARIRGYISTIKKQSKNVLESIEHALSGNPVDPTLT
jgi:transposase